MEGVLLTPMTPIEGKAGAVLHGIKRSSKGFVGFGEAYFSEVEEGGVKRWRRHRIATANLIVPRGMIRIVVHDDRGTSCTKGQFAEYCLGREVPRYARLTIQPGLWFAFQGLARGVNLLFNFSDREHNPQEAEQRELDAIPFGW